MNRMVVVLVMLVVTFALAPMAVWASGPKPGENVVLAENSVGYYHYNCTGDNGTVWRSEDGQSYYGNCVLPAQSGWSSGTVSRHINPFVGYKQNGMIRVCEGSGIHRVCRWFSNNEVMYPAHR